MPKAGYLTASTFPDLMKRGKSAEFSDTAMKHVWRLALDMMGVSAPDEARAPALDWGQVQEENAKFFYESERICTLHKASFRVCPDLPYVGGTIDALIGKIGGIEIKCPYNPANHVQRRKQWEEYKYQAQGYIWIYGLTWIDFVSYDPRFPADMQLIVERYERDEEIITQLEDRCRAAHDLALQIVDDVKNKRL